MASDLYGRRAGDCSFVRVRSGLVVVKMDDGINDPIDIENEMTKFHISFYMFLYAFLF